MALKISLKAFEKIILGGAVIKNGPHPSIFFIENNVLVLRERDIMTEEQADTPCKRIYFTVQLMYMDEKNLAHYHAIYWRQMGELTDTVKTMLAFSIETGEHILASEYYKALKVAKKMIAYEKELLDHAKQRV
ncbi:MAG: flagellar biosynthesis repressor FlbT [Desulfuromonadales bacterium]